MGIRVHKSVGYGFRKFKPTAKFLERMESCELTLTKFADWCDENTSQILTYAVDDPTRFREAMLSIDLAAMREKRRAKEHLSRCVNYQDEFGLPDVIQFIPPTLRDEWTRYDDSVDYVEETECHNQKNRFLYVERELYPFNKNKPPLQVAALLLYFGLERYWPRLRECLYIHWG
jgi:hypothetical protein